MPPSAPTPFHQQPPIVPGESEAAVLSPSTSPSQEYSDNDDENKWNQSKPVIENYEIKKQAQHTTTPSNPSPTSVPAVTQLIPPVPIDTGFNTMWNTNTSSMMGMNPYNTYNNPMNPSNSMYGNYGGFGNGMIPPSVLPMLGGSTSGPFSSITNYLLGIQNVIMSIGQVVQIISFNASSLQQLCESILAMIEHAIRSWHEQQ